jgi:hypothetical protein
MPNSSDVDPQQYINQAKSSRAQAVIEGREASHGDYRVQAGMAQVLKREMRQTKGWLELSLEQRESLEMIAVKISRILNGNPNEPDHWIDLAGYAQLCYNLLTKETHL